MAAESVQKVAFHGVARCAQERLEAGEKWAIPGPGGQACSEAEVPRNSPRHKAKSVKSPSFWKGSYTNCWVSSLIFDKCKWAENILEIFSMLQLVAADEAHLTSYSVQSVAAPVRQGQCLSLVTSSSREVCFTVTPRSHRLMSPATLSQHLREGVTARTH